MDTVRLERLLGTLATPVVLGILALAWTVVMIWGSIRALSGRSRQLWTDAFVL